MARNRCLVQIDKIAHNQRKCSIFWIVTASSLTRWASELAAHNVLHLENRRRIRRRVRDLAAVTLVVT
jgi:hypothetical protein